MSNSWGLELGDNITFAFSLTKTKNFYEELNNWIGDVFYDILPEKGFDLRDEQVFMAFQLERAFKEKKSHVRRSWSGNGENAGISSFCNQLCKVCRQTCHHRLCG